MAADIVISDPCVVFALRRESMYFRRDYRFQQRFSGAPGRAQFRGPAAQTVLMLETGLGAAAMETSLRWWLDAPRCGGVGYRPRFVLSAGFSGALQPAQRVGDLIVATEVVDQKGNCWPATWQGHKVGHSLRECLPTRGASRLHFGRLLAVSELVSDPREKQRLGQQYQAAAVDMETAVVASMCHQHGVPFACVRAISDDLNTTLSPHLVDLLRHGRVAPLNLAWSVFRHPSMIRELWRLAGHTRLAAERLRIISDFLER